MTMHVTRADFQQVLNTLRDFCTGLDTAVVRAPECKPPPTPTILAAPVPSWGPPEQLHNPEIKEKTIGTQGVSGPYSDVWAVSVLAG